MPRRRLRTRSVRRIPRRLPGGETRIRYGERRGGVPRCGRCGRPLPGLSPGLVGLPRSSRRASRPFADLCSRCSREVLRALHR